MFSSSKVESSAAAQNAKNFLYPGASWKVATLLNGGSSGIVSLNFPLAQVNVHVVSFVVLVIQP